MCDVLSGVPGCVTKYDRGRGRSKLAKNSVMYFMDGALRVLRITGTNLMTVTYSIDLGLSWFPRFRFCGYSRNLESTITIRLRLSTDNEFIKHAPTMHP